jgi:alpha-1,2-mannosyltransferase
MMFPPLLITVLVLVTSTFLVPVALRLLAGILGTYLTYRTLPRRRLLLSTTAEAISREDNIQDSTEDAEWEKVDPVTGSSPNGSAAEDDWRGIVGFFHPFWFVSD